MSRIQEILGVGLIIHDLFVIITGLIVFTGQERTPSDRTPSLRAFIVQIIYLEIIFQRLIIILEFKMAVADTYLDR